MFKKLIFWSKSQYSHFPWRVERSLYRTLVSEIMLQQTTIGTVLNHFEKFIGKYPDLQSLAKASEEEILIAWKGLGYYRRAKNLRHIAHEIMTKHQGRIPTKEDELLKLKGVGNYTAHALMAMGADQRALAVDANLERVLSRFYGFEEIKGPKLQHQILNDFKNKKILIETKGHSSRELNEALMDLGRVLCQKKKTWCHICPLSSKCVAHQLRSPLSFPKENLKTIATKFELELLRIVVREKNKIMVYQKNENEWLSGQWELPTFVLSTDDNFFLQYPKVKLLKKFENLPIVKSSITKYKITNRIIEMDKKDFTKTFKIAGNKYLLKNCDKKLNLTTTSSKILLFTAK